MERLWIELIACLIGDGDQEAVPDLITTMKEIIRSKTVTAKSFNADACEADQRSKWLDHIAGKIKEARKAADMTQTQLAEKSGLPQSHISRLEKANHSPSRKTLQRIADALGVDVKIFNSCSDRGDPST